MPHASSSIALVFLPTAGLHGRVPAGMQHSCARHSCSKWAVRCRHGHKQVPAGALCRNASTEVTRQPPLPPPSQNAAAGEPAWQPDPHPLEQHVCCRLDVGKARRSRGALVHVRVTDQRCEWVRTPVRNEQAGVSPGMVSEKLARALPECAMTTTGLACAYASSVPSLPPDKKCLAGPRHSMLCAPAGGSCGPPPTCPAEGRLDLVSAGPSVHTQHSPWVSVRQVAGGHPELSAQHTAPGVLPPLSPPSQEVPLSWSASPRPVAPNRSSNDAQ